MIYQTSPKSGVSYSITYLHSVISHSHSLVNEEDAVSSCDLLRNGPQRIRRAEGQCGNREDRLGQHDGRPKGWQYYQLVGSMVRLRILKAVLPALLLLDLQDAGPAKYLNTWPADGTTRFIEGMGGFLKSTCVPKKQPTAGREHGPLTRDKVDDPVANATWHA